MKTLLSDVWGIYAAAFRLLAEPKVLITHLVVGVLFGGVLIAILVAMLITIFYGSIDIEHLSTAEAVTLAGIALAILFPANFLISRLIHFSAAEAPRPRYFRDFRVSREEWVNAGLLLFLAIVLSGVSAFTINAPAGDSGNEPWLDLILYSAFSSVASILILMPMTIIAVHDPGGWDSARTWLHQLFMPMFAAYFLLTIASCVLLLPFEWALATIESGTGTNEDETLSNALGLLVLLVTLLFATFVLTFAIIAGGYRYWRESFVR